MKNGTHIIELYANSFGTQFQNNIDIFSCALAEKSGKHDGVSFLNAFFALLLPLLQNKCHFSYVHMS